MLAKKLQEVAGNGASESLYVEDVFSTYLYKGNDGTQSIVNGIDLSTKGGLIWNKDRNNTYHHYLADTVRGRAQLISNSTSAQFPTPAVNTDLVSYNSNGFTVGPPNTTNINGSGRNYVAWTFRKAPKFFDVVTYTGDGVAGRQIAHSLGVAPGMILIKGTSSAANWAVYHRSIGNASYLVLNQPQEARAGLWNSTTPTSSVFTLGSDAYTNDPGVTYVAYLFAHNAGGFGANGTDNVISCGSFSSTGQVTLGYEPQWVMMKSTTNASDYTGDWRIFDNMRGIVPDGDDAQLFANSSRAEDTVTFGTALTFNATGFVVEGQGNYGASTVYMAIRRPNKPPTSGTQVYNAFLSNTANPGGVPKFLSNFPVDMFMFGPNIDGVSSISLHPRLTQSKGLTTSSTSAEEGNGNYSSSLKWDYNIGVHDGGSFYPGTPDMGWMFKRAPGFFDVVCYRGTGTANRAVTHNLTVAPELLICKSRTVGSTFWRVLWTGSLANSLNLNGTSSWSDLAGNAPYFFGDGTTSGSATAPTSTNFYVADEINQNTQSIVAYLFATCAGVSKVGSYTGNGSSQNIECGFAAGARFVLVKATSTTGDWYIFDSARGLTSGSSPYLRLNSAAAETTGNNGVYASTGGFTLGATAITTTNIAAATYIFLAVA